MVYVFSYIFRCLFRKSALQKTAGARLLADIGFQGAAHKNIGDAEAFCVFEAAKLRTLSSLSENIVDVSNMQVNREKQTAAICTHLGLFLAFFLSSGSSLLSSYISTKILAQRRLERFSGTGTPYFVFPDGFTKSSFFRGVLIPRSTCCTRIELYLSYYVDYHNEDHCLYFSDENPESIRMKLIAQVCKCLLGKSFSSILPQECYFVWQS